MRWLVAISMALACGAARCDDAADAPDIVMMMHRSHQLRLDAMPLADLAGPREHRVRESFDTLVRRLRTATTIELRVVRGATVAETLQGRIVVANESLGDLTEGERLFILAHEIGHVMLGHWSEVGLLYRRWFPGRVTAELTAGVAEPLGRDASTLAHRQEFEADAFGLRAVRALGGATQEVEAALMTLGVRERTPTHPGTNQRLAALRRLEPEHLQATRCWGPSADTTSRSISEELESAVGPLRPFAAARMPACARGQVARGFERNPSVRARPAPQRLRPRAVAAPPFSGPRSRGATKARAGQLRHHDPSARRARTALMARRTVDHNGCPASVGRRTYPGPPAHARSLECAQRRRAAKGRTRCPFLDD